MKIIFEDGYTPTVKCDVCGDSIRKNDDRELRQAYVLWNPGEGGERADAVVVHQGKCDPGAKIYLCSMPLRTILEEAKVW